ncbi:MAG: hypothetical protein JSV63_04380 [Candidatus Aenigmatarchaeota archaeon]|nr:MAG: hypothetical protein JSV63_04380 [Candidatus Aenigmarchaeota archaeon]
MLRKAQTEIALIVGLIIIVVVVAVFSFYSLVPIPVRPASVGEDQKAVEAYVRDTLTKETVRAIVEMYKQGGYTDISGVRAVKFSGNDVPYWQICDEVTIPPPADDLLEDELEIALANSIPERVSIAGRQVLMDKNQMNTEVSIFDNKVVVTLMLPTTLDGAPLPQPYTVEIDTDMGRILSFSEDFSKTMRDYRILDINLVRIIRRSNPYDSCWLPTTGVSPSSSFRKSWSTLRNCMEEVIYHTLSHTFEWQRPILRFDGGISDEMLRRSFIPQVFKYDENDWGQYVDLEIDFHFAPQGRSLSKTDPELFFNTDPDPVKFTGHNIPIIPSVTLYEVNYSVSFPVVMRVWDNSLKAYFQFATFVDVENMAPSTGTCDIGEQIEDEYTRICVDEATILGKIRVKNFGGKYLEGVYVSLDRCELGRTGERGLLERNVPSVENSPLELYDPFGDVLYTECVDITGPFSRVFTMPIKKKYAVEFYGVYINDNPFLGPFRVLRVKRDLSEAETKNIDVSMAMKVNDCTEPVEYAFNNYYRVTDTGNVEQGSFEKIDKDIPATAVYNGTVIMGSLTVYNETVIDYNKNVIYVYAPIKMVGGNYEEDPRVMQLYKKCGINPVSTQPPSTIPIGCVL